MFRMQNCEGLFTLTGWPRHRESREFGSYFFQTGKTQGICFDTGKNFETQGKILRHREIFFCDTGKNLDIGEIFDCDY